MDSVGYRCGDVEIDPGNRRFTRAGTAVALEPKTFAVILELLARPGALVTRNELLDSVWGHRYVTPSTLNRVIALARRAFGDDIEVPRFIQTVHGAGYRYIGPVEREQRATQGSPKLFAPPAGARLPARFEPLIGRETEIAALSKLFEAHRAVTVLGPGGIGKTQCALEAARRMASAYPDGVWFFDLVPMRQADDWLRAFAAALAIAPAGTSELLSRIQPVLRGRRALIVIDNCDRIAGDIGAITVELLRAADSLEVLATSQAPLNFKGEQLMRLLPLALPEFSPDAAPSMQSIAAAPAVQMLLARIGSVRPGFEQLASNASTIADICRRLDGMPLAMELAAPRFALLSPEQVLMRLDQRFKFLSSELSGRDDRHHSLVALLDWSFSLLSSEEQRLLTWLSIFVKGWSVDAAMGFAKALGRDPESVVDLLSGLVNKSLVTVDMNPSPPRYYLLETVRDYALGHLRTAGEEDRARAAHLEIMVQMTQAAYQAMLAGRMRETLEQLVLEDQNIAAALEQALAADSSRPAALAIVGALTLYIKMRGLYHLAAQSRPAIGRTAGIVHTVIGRTGGLESVHRARALLCYGVALVHLSPATDGPEAVLMESRRLALQYDDPWTQAYASGYCALWLSNQGRVTEAGQQTAALERIAERLGDSHLLGLAGLARGWMQIALGNYAIALNELRQVRSLGHDIHQRHFIDVYIAFSLYGLGEVAAAAGEWAEALRNAGEVGNVRGMAGSIEGCAYIANRLGQWSDALRYLQVAERIRVRTDVPLFNFWLPLHQSAHASLRSQLGTAEYEACAAAVALVRDEDVVNEVGGRLSYYAASLP